MIAKVGGSVLGQIGMSAAMGSGMGAGGALLFGEDRSMFSGAIRGAIAGAAVGGMGMGASSLAFRGLASDKGTRIGNALFKKATKGPGFEGGMWAARKGSDNRYLINQSGGIWSYNKYTKGSDGSLSVSAPGSLTPHSWAAGASAFFMGSRDNKTKYSHMNAAQWTQGTHPMYYNGGAGQQLHNSRRY